MIWARVAGMSESTIRRTRILFRAVPAHHNPPARRADIDQWRRSFVTHALRYALFPNELQSRRPCVAAGGGHAPHLVAATRGNFPGRTTVENGVSSEHALAARPPSSLT